MVSSSLRVRNPASSHHLVPLHTNQRLEVVFTGAIHPDYKTVEAELRSDWLHLERIDYDEDYAEKTFVFTQTHNLKNYSTLSTHFLGEIVLRKEAYSARLCVNLETTNSIKRDIITVINPIRNVIKIYPHQIVEVVCSNPLWGSELEWSVIDLDARMELLAIASVTPDSFDPEKSQRTVADAFYIYPRCLGWSTTPVHQEFHFWLRIKPVVAKILTGIPGGINPVKLLFHGRVREGNKSLTKAEQSLEVNFNPRSKSKNPRSEIVTYHDSCMNNPDEHSFGDGINFDEFIDQMDDADLPECRPLTRKERKLARQREKRRIEKHCQNWDNCRQFHQAPAAKGSKPVVQRKITLVQKHGSSLEDGCRVFHAKEDAVRALAPPPGVPSLQEILDSFDTNDGGDYAF